MRADNQNNDFLFQKNQSQDMEKNSPQKIHSTFLYQKCNLLNLLLVAFI